MSENLQFRICSESDIVVWKWSFLFFYMIGQSFDLFGRVYVYIVDTAENDNLFPTQLLHRGGPFINSLLYLEELGFRSPSPTIKKIAFIAWKSLIDNFALNPGELTSGI